MSKMMFAAAMIAAGTAAAPAVAQTTYTTRAAFNAAAGATSTVDFNGYTSDTQFRTAAVDVGPFSLVGSGNRQDDRNFIDAAPYLFDPFFNVNNSSYVLGSVGGFADGTSGFEILFDTPTFAFGADFKDLNDLAGLTQITINSTNYVPGVNAGFFGYTSATGFTSVRFSSTGPRNIDGFGMDNVTFSAVTAPVPEPATWAMMIVGFGIAGATVRRCKPAQVSFA